MTYESALQALIYGLQTGLTYILLALGLTLIFSIMGIINIAHGEIHMLGAFAVFYFVTLIHIDYMVSLLLGFIVVGLFGVFLDRVFFRPLRGSNFVRVIIIITGLQLVIQGGAQLVFGTEPRGMSEAFHGAVSFLGVTISASRVASGLISIVLLAITCFFVYRTRFGRAMQAFAQDPEAAALYGVDINKITALGFGLGFALAAVAGGLTAPIYYIEPVMGLAVLPKAMSIILLGGVGSIPGAAIAGLFLGVLESFGLRFIGYPSYIFFFVIIILVILVRPRGLMGREA